MEKPETDIALCLIIIGITLQIMMGLLIVILRQIGISVNRDKSEWARVSREQIDVTSLDGCSVLPA